MNHKLLFTISHIIKVHLPNLKVFPPLLPAETAMLELLQDQYHALSTITTYIGKNNGINWPYFFITGSAGTEKLYIINLIVNMFNRKQSNFLLLAPTEISAQNIGGKTIHSELCITSTQGGFHTCVPVNMDLTIRLKRIDTIIIDEISMVSAELFDFISNMFAKIHNNSIAFGGINVIIVGDLTQLPPVIGQPVFYSTAWNLFYPLLLRTPQHKHNEFQLRNYFAFTVHKTQGLTLPKVSLTLNGNNMT